MMKYKYKYMASWKLEDKIITEFKDIPKEPSWQLWNGKLKNGQDPPKRVKIMITGLIYSWEDFQKIRKKK